MLRYLIVASVSVTALYPMRKSGLMAAPARPMMGMNMVKVAKIRYMLSVTGTNSDSKCTASHL